MHRLTTDIVSLGPWWGKGEQTTSVYVPLMTRIKVSHNTNIPAFEDNLALSVQVDGNGNMSPALVGCKP